MAIRPATVCLITAGVLVAACQGLVGIEDSPAAKPDAGGAGGTDASAGAAGVAGAAGTGGTAGADGATDAGCLSAQPPPPNPTADPGGNIDFVVAVRTVDLGDRDLGNGPTWPNLGYDLDKLCTCSSDPDGSCKAPNKTVCDGVDGRDNALGSLLSQVRTLFNLKDLSSDDLTTKIEGGGNTVLIRVQGYNGTANDAVVEVAWMASDDFDETNTAPPKWDGSDEWPVISNSLVGKVAPDGGTQFSVDNARYVDTAAYVTNGTLVASLPDGTFSLTAKTAIQFSAAIFTASVKSSAGSWALEDGVLAGITKVSDILGTLPAIDDPLFGMPLCTDNLLYSGIKELICEFPDMTILATPAKPCDHLSMALRVSAQPATLGSVIVQKPGPSSCAPGTDPADDGC